MDASIREVLDRAEHHCAERGNKLTEKRRHVLAGLLDSNKALSAYELAALCRTKRGVDLLPNSVYRILEFLEGENLVHHLKLANKYVACSHIVCDHEHEAPQFLICKICNQVKEVAISRATIRSIAKMIESVDFRLASSQLELDCLCAACATAEGA